MAAAETSAPEKSAAAEWREGWPVVLSAAFGLGVTSLYFYTLGMMIPPLTKAFGWSQAQITAGPIIISAFYFCLAARVGALVDAHGIRKILLPGYCGFCLALAGLGLAGPSIWSWYALWALMALIFTTTAPSLWAMAVVSRFDKARAMALSIALCSTGIMGALTPNVQAWAISVGGWRMGYFLLGGGMLVVGLPVLWFCLPKAVPVPAGGAATAPVEQPGLTFREALHSVQFWIIATLSLTVGACVAALMVHLPSIGISQGMSTGKVAAITGLIGLFAIGGRLATGALMDRLPVRVVGAVAFSLPFVACLILAWDLTPGMMTLAAIVIGIVNGGDYNVLAMLTSRYLGTRAYAAIYSQIAAAFNIGVGIGPMIMGAFHDHVHLYAPLLVALAAIFILSGVLAGSLGREPDFGRKA